MRHFTW
ncbi:unnamed protein product [Acanthoscelides obtectus]|nr:unnamed protein product [Acanthoscelides obtectus]CAK1670908.1 hypothetical protein AOBTE_LOCUS27908 [Acanthoscelides obtectus]